MVCGNMEVETVPYSFMNDLYDSKEEKVQNAVLTLKNTVIGSQKQKDNIIERGDLSRLIHLLMDPDMKSKIKTDVVYIISSIISGHEAESDMGSKSLSLNDTDLVTILIQGLSSKDGKLVSACLSCLQGMLQLKTPLLAPDDFDTEMVPNQCQVIYSSPDTVTRLLSLSSCDASANHQIAVCNILTSCCRTPDHQNILVASGSLVTMTQVLTSHVTQVQVAGLQCVAALVFNNANAGLEVTKTTYQGKSLLSLIIHYTGRENNVDIQLAAGRVLTYMYRSEVLPMQDRDNVVMFRVLPCLVRMCKKEETTNNRIVAAETLAYLIEVNADLQRMAAISNHLISTMSSFLRYDPDCRTVPGMSRVQLVRLAKKLEKRTDNCKQLKRAAFKVFASLGANDEDIRKKIIDTEPLMDNVVNALDDPDPSVQMPAIRCLHSLSRSVQLLRTTFQDHGVWEPLMKILATPGAKVESLVIASSTLCNLLLEFSPSKERILDGGAVELLCSLTHKNDPSLRLNGVWGLMNMAFQAEQRIKSQIMSTLGTDQVFRLLSDTEIHVVMKTLGLLRNLLSNKHHIDYITNIYGKQLMQAVVLILESEHTPDVKEQAVCILGNIADGDSAKKLIIDNEDMLRKLTTYMLHNDTKLQIAAVVCIQNLIWRNDEGSSDRQLKLKEIGVFKILHQLLNTTDQALFEKVKSALQQLSL